MRYFEVYGFISKVVFLCFTFRCHHHYDLRLQSVCQLMSAGAEVELWVEGRVADIWNVNSSVRVE